MLESIFLRLTSELSGAEMRSIFASGGGAKRRNELERFVICFFLLHMSLTNDSLSMQIRQIF